MSTFATFFAIGALRASERSSAAAPAVPPASAASKIQFFIRDFRPQAFASRVFPHPNPLPPGEGEEWRPRESNPLLRRRHDGLGEVARLHDRDSGGVDRAAHRFQDFSGSQGGDFFLERSVPFESAFQEEILCERSCQSCIL